MHFLLALVLVFGLALGVGIANDNVTQVGTISSCVPVSVTAYDNGTCTGVPPDLPGRAGRAAGRRRGDRLRRPSGEQLQPAHRPIRPLPPGTPVTITVRRDGKLVTLHTKLANVKGRSGSYLGIGPAVLFQVASPLGAIEYSGTTFGQVLVGSAQAVAALPGELPKLFDKNRSRTVGAARSSAWSARPRPPAPRWPPTTGWQYKVSFVLLLIASLNIFVGAFNLLPLLPLDGGHIAVIIYERIRAWLARLRGRPDPGLANMAKFLPVSFSLFVVLIVFSLALVLANIVNPVSLTGG